MDSRDLLPASAGRLFPLADGLDRPALAQPAPCSGRDVRALLSHTITTIDAFSSGEELSSGADRAGGNPARVAREPVARSHRAWSSVQDWESSGHGGSRPHAGSIHGDAGRPDRGLLRPAPALRHAVNAVKISHDGAGGSRRRGWLSAARGITGSFWCARPGEAVIAWRRHRAGYARWSTPRSQISAGRTSEPDERGPPAWRP